MNGKQGWMMMCAAALVGVAACSNSDDDLQAWAPRVEGIYRVDALTQNTATCDAPGATALADDRDHMLVLSGHDAFGSWIRSDGCADPADCRQRLAALRADRGVTVTFSYVVRQASGDHLEGQWVTTGFSGGPSGLCTDAVSSNIELAQPGEGTVRIEARSVVLDHPPDAEGICWTGDTEKAAAGQPCNQLDIVAATRIEAL